MSTIHVGVANIRMIEAETLIFSGEAEIVALLGESGELGIYPQHIPLTTRATPSRYGTGRHRDSG